MLEECPINQIEPFRVGWTKNVLINTYLPPKKTFPNRSDASNEHALWSCEASYVQSVTLYF